MIDIRTKNKQIILLLRYRSVYTVLLAFFFISNSFKDGFARSLNLRLIKTVKDLDLAFTHAFLDDVVMMQNGTWKDIDILVKDNDTKEKPITLKAETRGKVIISGKPSLSLSGRHLIVDGLLC